MRKSSILVPLAALIAGGFGFFLRRAELASVFDELTGLAERGASVTVSLVVLSFAVILFGIVFSITARISFTSPYGFEHAFGASSITYPLSFSILGIVWLAGTAAHFLNVSSAGAIPLIEVYFTVLSAISAVSVIIFSIEVYREPSRKAKHVLSIAPSLFMCFWLVLLYRSNAANPVLLSYCYQCLAIISSALGFYFTSGYVFSKVAPGKTVFAYLSSIFFCFVTLADDLTLGVKLIFSAIAVIQLVHCHMLIKNLERKPIAKGYSHEEGAVN